VLRAEAGVGRGEEVLHPQAVHPLVGQLGFAEGEPVIRDIGLLYSVSVDL
jgi:hypothetical protein